jgi:hypothetical protein
MSELSTDPEKENSDSVNMITSISFDDLWNNFPKNSTPYDIFPIIFPNEYQKSPGSFMNACATRLSLALNKVGVKPTLQFKTQQDLKYDGITYPKGIPITTSAIKTPPYLTSNFGEPSFVGENTMENINKYLKGQKGIFTITGVPGWRASGHADIFINDNGEFKCGASCNFGSGGTIQAWFVV